MDQSTGHRSCEDKSREERQDREGRSRCRVGQGNWDRRGRYLSKRDWQWRSRWEGGSQGRGKHRQRGNRTGKERQLVGRAQKVQEAVGGWPSCSEAPNVGPERSPLSRRSSQAGGWVKGRARGESKGRSVRQD